MAIPLYVRATLLGVSESFTASKFWVFNVNTPSAPVLVLSGNSLPIAADGSLEILVTDTSLVLDDKIELIVSDYNGTNETTYKGSLGVTDVVRDPPPPVVGVPDQYILAVGDSFTDYGSSYGSGENITLQGRTYWNVAINSLTTSRYIMEHDQGVAGDETADVLARMAAITSSPADIVMILLGINDISNGVPLATIKTNIDSIISQIRAVNKKILITPVLYRYTPSDQQGMIDDVDEINAHYASKAAADDDITIAETSATFNTLITSTDSNDRALVSDDNLHPNNYGARLIAIGTAAALDNYLPAYLSDQDNNRLVNPEFLGTGGNVSSPSTGVMPDNWSGKYGVNPSGDTYAIENIVGTNYIRAISSPEGSPSTDRYINIEPTPHFSVDAGRYIAEVEIEFLDITAPDQLYITLEDETAATPYIYCRQEVVGVFDPTLSGTKVVYRTPPTHMLAGTANLWINSKSADLVNGLNMLIGKPKVIKVD